MLLFSSRRSKGIKSVLQWSTEDQLGQRVNNNGDPDSLRQAERHCRRVAAANLATVAVWWRVYRFTRVIKRATPWGAANHKHDSNNQHRRARMRNITTEYSTTEGVFDGACKQNLRAGSLYLLDRLGSPDMDGSEQATRQPRMLKAYVASGALRTRTFTTATRSPSYVRKGQYRGI